MNAANALPVVGTELAYGLGFGMLVLIVFTEVWGESLTTVAHEGGHMIMAVLTFRGHKGFHMEEDGNAGTQLVKSDWSVGDLITRFAGYPTPPLFGLGGAILIRTGNAIGALVIGLVLVVAAFFQARNSIAIAVTLLTTIGVGWVLFAGTPYVKVALATALVWWMLIGGALDSTVRLSRGQGSDAYWLARRTLVPRIVWHAIWAVIAIVCLWKGGRALLAV